MRNHLESSGRQPSRREFVRAGAGLSAAGLAALGAVDKLLAADLNQSQSRAKPIIQPSDTVLFQGDSITDAGRKRDVTAANSQLALGGGYAWFAVSQLLVDSPQANFKIFNRGISGNKVYQ